MRNNYKIRSVNKKISLQETAFVIGSGPSLNKIDMSLLKGLNTFSMNRQYIAYDDWGFYPKFYVVIDWRQIKTIHKDLSQKLINNPKCSIEKYFIMDHFNSYLCGFDLLKHMHIDSNNLDKVIFTKYTPSGNDIIQGGGFPAGYNSRLLKSPGYNISFHANAGAYTTALAYLLGFKRVVLLGVDAKYYDRKDSEKQGVDLDHFHPKYFDPKEFKYGIDTGSADEWSGTLPWNIMKNGAKSVVRLLKSNPNTRETLFGEIETISKCQNSLHLCSSSNFEIISCSHNSKINSFFPYYDLKSLLSLYDN